MAHYYSEKPESESLERTLHYEFNGRTFTFVSDTSVFSKDHVDYATDLLLKTIKTSAEMKRGLDLGCGYGVIGIVLAKENALDMTFSDVNERALALCERNLKANQVEGTVIKSDGFTSILGTFDIIVTNPPIRIGKTSLYGMFHQAYQHLNDTGELWFVMHKKHGVQSALTYFESFSGPEVVKRKKGFHIIRIRKD